MVHETGNIRLVILQCALAEKHQPFELLVRESTVRKSGKLPFADSARPEQVQRNINAAFLERCDQIVQFIHEIRTDLHFAVFRNDRLVDVEQMHAQNIVSGRRVMFRNAIHHMFRLIMNPVYDIRTVKAERHAGTFFKLELIPPAHHSPVFSGWRVQKTGKINRAARLHGSRIADRQPVFARPDHNRFRTRRIQTDIRKRRSDDQPVGVAAGRECDPAYRFARQFVTGRIESDRSADIASPPCHDSFFPVARHPEIADMHPADHRKQQSLLLHRLNAVQSARNLPDLGPFFAGKRKCMEHIQIFTAGRLFKLHGNRLRHSRHPFALHRNTGTPAVLCGIRNLEFQTVKRQFPRIQRTHVVVRPLIGPAALSVSRNPVDKSHIHRGPQIKRHTVQRAAAQDEFQR